jgi:hypothetical protein
VPTLANNLFFESIHYQKLQIRALEWAEFLQLGQINPDGFAVVLVPPFMNHTSPSQNCLGFSGNQSDEWSRYGHAA